MALAELAQRTKLDARVLGLLRLGRDRQQRLRHGLALRTVDGVIHSALRGMLRDAKIERYSVPDLRTLYDGQMLTRLR